MQSLLLTYSGMSGGQYLTFKPTLLAALLASGVGTYLYQEQPEGRPQQQSKAGRTDQKADFKANFYGAARAAEPQMPVRFVPTAAKTGIDQVSSTLADTGLDHDAFIAAMRLDQRAQTPQRFRPQLGQAGSERNQDVDQSLQEPAKAELATATSQPSSTGSVVPSGLAAAQAALQPDLGRDEIAPGTSLALAIAGQSPQSIPIAPMTAVAASAVLREEVAVEAGTELALAIASLPMLDSPSEPAASAVLPAAPSPMLANAELVARTETGVAAAVPDTHLAVSPAALAPRALVPAAPPQQPPRTELVPAVAPAVREAPSAAAEPAAGLSDLQQASGPAPLAVQPIKFKLQPTAKNASPSAGLAAARRSERAGQAVKPGLNGSVSRKSTRLPDRVVGEFILHQVSVRLNDSPAGNIDVRIGGDASLSIRVGTLLSVVEGRLDPELFAALNKSAGADAYVSFRELRAAGFDVRYEPAGETIVLTAD